MTQKQNTKSPKKTTDYENRNGLEETAQLQNSAIQKIGSFIQKQASKGRMLLWLALVLSAVSVNAQTAEWTWVAGSSSGNQAGHYGAKGVAHALNVPGARNGHGSAVDESGNLWIFGGLGKDANGSTGHLNDLWKWDGSLWTWMAGDSTANQGSRAYHSTNIRPGGRKNMGMWIKKDTIYLFGGYGKTFSGQFMNLNELWKWDGTNWKWLRGNGAVPCKYGTKGQSASTNYPGGRNGMAGWIGEFGHLFIHGGYGYANSLNDLGYLNDLWRWDGTNWTWLSGTKNINVTGSFGTINTPAVSNLPPSLAYHTIQHNSNGEILLFGGKISLSGTSNGLWKWDGINWTWISGSTQNNKKGVYNISHIPNSNSVPGSRGSHISWTDQYDNLYIFGGMGRDKNGVYGALNDFWKWDGFNWYWLGGSKLGFKSSNHGGLGIYASTNIVGARFGHSGASINAYGSGLVHGGGDGSSNLKNELWRCNLVYKIENGGHLYEKKEQLSLASATTTGNALQDSGDIITIGNISNAFIENDVNLPANSNVAKRIKRNWRINITDVNSNGGTMNVHFHLDSLFKPLVSYYLLKRASKNDDFTVVPNTNFGVEKTDVIFTVDLDDLDHNYLYTIGRSDDFQGNALNFDAATTSDYVELPALLNPSSTNFTAETWFKVNKVNNSMILFGQLIGTGTPRNLLFINSVGKIRSKLGNVVTSTNETIVANKWYHGAITYDGTTAKVYLNGILVASQSVTAESCDGNWLLGISSALTLPLDGEMDEVRIWNTVRTGKRIKSNMHRPLKGNEPNLLAYYKFDRHEGTHLSDASTNSNGGTLKTFALTGTESNWVTSSVPVADSSLASAMNGPGYGLQFDGGDDYVSIPNFFDPTANNWSIECWMKSDSTAYSRNIIGQEDGTGTGSILLKMYQRDVSINSNGSSVATTGDVLTDGEWSHIALTKSGSTYSIYVNGILQAQGTLTAIAANGNINIGRWKSQVKMFTGTLDEIRFWSTTRTATEIQDNMYNSLEANETGLLAYYSCDEISGASLFDESRNSNDGTLNNFTTSSCWINTNAREPFKTLKAGAHNSGDIWKDGTAPSSSSDRIAVFHDLSLSSTGTYQRLQVSEGANVTVSADVNISGDVIINGSLSGNNKIVLNGSAKQCIGGSGAIGNLQINNSNDVSLEGDLTLNGALTLTSGDIEVNDHTLTLTGATSHGSSSSYIKINGTGSVKKTVGSDPIILPIGRNPYLPIIIDDGGGAEYTVGVSDGVYTDPSNPTTEITNQVVTETWTIQASQAATGVTVQVGWDAAEESNLTRTNCGIGYWENGVSSAWQRAPNTSAATGSDPYFQTRTLDMSTNLYYFGVGGTGSALPVELTYFEATWKEQGQTTQLNWETSLEENNSHFEVERSFDGQTWKQIGRVEGVGNSISSIDYQFVDELETQNQKHKAIYYRLKQVDYNGNFEFSEIRTLNQKTENRNSISIYPNPASNRLHISSNHPIISVEILNLQGQIVQVSNGDTREINISHLASGTYVIKTQAFGNIQLQKLRVN